MIAANAAHAGHAAVLVLAGWLTAFAQLGGDAPQHRLAVQIAGPSSLITELTNRLTTRLAARAVELDVTTVSSVDFERLATSPPAIADEPPLARVWLDGRDAARALLFLLPRQGDRVLVRKVELSGGFDEVALAQTTYIIDRAVASLLMSEPIGVPTSQAPAAVAAVLPPTPTAVAVAETGPAALSFRVGAFGGVGAWSGEALATARLGIEGALQRNVGGARRLGLAASAIVEPAFHVTEPGSDLLARSLALHLYATVTWRAGRAGLGGLGIGPALIVTRIDPTLSVASVTESASSAPRTDFDPAVGLTARWDVPVGKRTTIFLAGLLDVIPIRARYAVANGAEERAVFSPWLLRPGLVLGVSTGSELR